MSEIVLEAILENIPQVTAFIDGELEKIDCPMKVQMQIDVAVDEMFSNIARYAYAPGVGEATVRFDYDASTRAVTIAFIDSGVPFDPLQQAAPNVALSPEEREIGGLGIFLVRKMMDDVRYRREDGRNILTIHTRI